MKNESFRHYAFALLLSLAFNLLMPFGARAVCELAAFDERSQIVDAGGVGGTGLPLANPEGNATQLGDEGSGAGGTGYGGDDGDGSGAGGTGYGGDDGDGSGAGGTGILGTITGFGSVCVNGLRVRFNSSTPVSRDGESISSNELAVGQVVRITTRSERLLIAKNIVVENALSGPVTRVDRANSRVWVMEQPVELRVDVPVFDRAAGRATVVEDIEIGQRVDVSGMRRGDGVVVASRVETRTASRLDSATGVATVAIGRTAYVGELRGSLAPGAALPASSGSRIVMRGEWNATTRTLERASVEAASPGTGDVRRLSLEGFVEPARDGADFEIEGTPVDASAISDTPRRGSHIQIEGRLGKDGRLRAERISVRHPGSEAGLHDDRDRGRGDKSGRSGRSGRGDRADREERADRSGSGRGDRAERPDRNDRSEREDRSERSGRN